MTDGRRQSPIDIRPDQVVAAGPDGLPPLAFRYSASATLDGIEITPERRPGDPTGTVLVTVAEEAGELRLGDSTYHLLQFHWHWPGEHELDGRGFPVEMHLVHRRRGTSGLDDLLVVAMWLEEGETHPELEKIFGLLPEYGATGRIAGRTPGFDLGALLPARLASFRYAGSLTTPSAPGQTIFPETVEWVILHDRMRISKAQMDAFRTLFPDGNRRCLQPLHGRTILTDVELSRE